MKFRYYSDPGHGWLAVKRSLIDMLGISSQISRYSYQKGNTVYLEEDCDLALFAQSFSAVGGWIEYINKYTDRPSPIRNYQKYCPNTLE